MESVSKCGSLWEEGMVRYWMLLWIRNASPPPLSLPRSFLSKLKFGVFGEVALSVNFVS